ncbi:ABC transporter ATP-binding protein [Streptosporangium oxazolinicum]|uniref:ABC transporter ATP-binding protein n=1 Tax=Streptosporangium oxazolinicum TaxID=909287 RepID=A0ABP8BP87_9ACTN
MSADSGDGAALHVADLRAGYGDARVLHGLDLTVGRGEICAVLGPNGAGKTTMLRALSGMVRGRGTARLGDIDLLGRSPDALARLGVAHVPEGRGTFTQLTVAENLRLGAYSRRDRDGIATDLERVHHYFPVLKERLRQPAGSLSGGEQQMLAIGRALMLRPRLLLLDEPSLGLSPKLTRELFGIITSINERERTSVVVVEQNAHLALDVAQRAYVLETGRIVLSGPAEQIRADAQVAGAYLGYRV